MKHATEETFQYISDFLQEIREYVPPLKEKKLGTFYYKSSAFLHFHDDPSGVFADLKVEGEWVRYRVMEESEKAILLETIALQFNG